NIQRCGRSTADSASREGDRRSDQSRVFADAAADETRGTSEDQPTGGRNGIVRRSMMVAILVQRSSSGTVRISRANRAIRVASGNRSKIGDLQSRGVAQPGSAPALGER